MSVSDKIFFGGFVLFALVAGLCIGYTIADYRGRAKLAEQRDYIAGLETERDFYIDASEQLRGELAGVRASVGQLGDGLASAIETINRATSYRAAAQVFVDAARDIINRAGDIARAGATENTELAPLDDY